MLIPLQDEHGNLKAQTWTEALYVIKQRLQGVQGDQIRGIAGKLADAESMIALKVWLLLAWHRAIVVCGVVRRCVHSSALIIPLTARVLPPCIRCIWSITGGFLTSHYNYPLKVPCGWLLPVQSNGHGRLHHTAVVPCLRCMVANRRTC